MRDYYDVMREREQGPAGPVHIIIAAAGPEAGKKAADQVRTLFMSTGKVVRYYPDSREMPEEVPACDVAVIVHQQG